MLSTTSDAPIGDHYLVSPRTGGGFSIEDCDDTNSYSSLQELVEKSTILAGKQAHARNVMKTPVNAAGKSSLVTQLEEAKKALEQAINDIQKEEFVWRQTKQNLKTTLSNLNNVL